MIYQINNTDNNKSYTLKKGDEIKINLVENPTTGFQWHFINIDKNIFKITKDEYSVKGDGIGGGGIRSIELKAKDKGESKVELKNYK